MSSGNKRGPDPKDFTLRMLCGKSAGTCEFPGCGQRLFYDNITLKEFNNAFVAHIVASSPDGPRGDPVLSCQLSDKLDNLMLMCHTHHKLIDDNPDEYPIEKLHEIKRVHEEKITQACSLLSTPNTEMIFLASPIKGKFPVSIDIRQAAQAVIPNRQTGNPYGFPIDISSAHEYKTVSYWNDVTAQLNDWINTTFVSLLRRMSNIHISIFSLAPIPLIAKLGEMIGDKVPGEVFQLFRRETWNWQKSEQNNSFEIHKENRSKGNKVALILSLTADVAVERVLAIGDYNVIYKIKATRNDVDCIESREDLNAFWHQYQTVCDEVRNSFGQDSVIHLFPSVPVSAAYEIGRRYMPRAFPIIKVYDECEGFFETLTIGGGEKHDT